MADRWLTYAEAGELFGLSAEAMRKRAHRLRWRTQPGNEGRTLVLVPDGAELHPAAHPAGHHPGVRADELLAEVLAETRRRADAAEARNRELAAELAEQREARARAEGEAQATREALGHERGRAVEAEAERDAARAEVAQWTAGGPFARALRAFLNR